MEFALLVGVSLMVITTSTAKDPEGRVVNTKSSPSVKKPLQPSPERPGRGSHSDGREIAGTTRAETGMRRTPAATPAETDEVRAGPEGTVIRNFENIQVTEEESCVQPRNRRRRPKNRRCRAVSEVQAH